jgi:hypothetical protein
MGLGVYGVELAIVFLLVEPEEGIPVLQYSTLRRHISNDQSLICIGNTIDRGMFAKNVASTCLVVPIGPELRPCFLNLSSTSVLLFSLHLQTPCRHSALMSSNDANFHLTLSIT